MWEKTKSFIDKHKYKIIGGVSVLALGYYFYNSIRDQSKIKMSHFIKAVQLDSIQEVKIQGKTIIFKSSTSDWYSTLLGNYPIDHLFKLLREKNVIFSNQENSISTQIGNMAIATVLSLATLNYMIKEIQKPQVSNSNIESSIIKNNQTFNDFYGGESIKIKFKQIIDFLKQPQKYEKMGARIRRGVLFYGPPGTGKTLLARALANQANCEFIKVVASQFQQMFVGVGAKRVRELFKSARSCRNGCIIFIDQIDALGSRLNHLRDSHQTTSTINQFLSQMDGFSTLDKVVIVAATNRIDLVDYAILRAGRFDIKIHIQLPNLEQRKGIFTKLLDIKCKKYNINNQIVDNVARDSQSWCGADLQNLINQSIYKAIKQKSDTLQQKHIYEALKELQPIK